MVDQQLFQPYFSLLGWFVHSWAQFEQQLDIWIAVAWRDCGGSARGLEYPRTALVQKTDFLKRAVDLPGFGPYADRVVALLARAEALNQIRDTLIHGQLSVLTQKEVQLRLISAKRGGRLHHSKRTIRISAFVDACQEVTAMAGDGVRLSGELLAKYS